MYTVKIIKIKENNTYSREKDREKECPPDVTLFQNHGRKVRECTRAWNNIKVARKFLKSSLILHANVHFYTKLGDAA